jgi:glycosyltransferase involved in cell wall biosynthesis
MKVLVSAYACDPYQGSEPGVGWTAVCRIARQHDVWVLSHTRHQEGWERARNEGKVPPNVTVRFLGENPPWLENRFLAHLQSWKSYADFTAIVLDAAQAWHREVGFNLCHQVTIATWRVPSPLWQLPIPLVWGPIGGGGYIPPAFRPMLSPLARGFELARDFNSARALKAKSFQESIQNSAVVFAANEETELLLKPHRGDRPLVRLPIASITSEKAEKFQRPEITKPSESLRLFAGGNMEGRKGVSLALKALARVAAKGINFQYTVAGGGPEIPTLVKLARQLGLSNRVEFHPWFSGQDYIAALQATDVYFLPSFRESTPVTLLEAYLAGCYPVVADTSAQGEIVRMAGGSAVPVTSIEQLVDGLAGAIIDCAHRRDELSARVAESRVKLVAYFDSARYDQAIADAYRVAMESRPGSF